MSPESAKDGIYNHKSDVWSLGVIMYILLCGKPPFYGKTTEEILEKVKEAKYSMHRKEMEHVSSNAKDLVQRMLLRDPAGRYSAL